LTLSRLDTPFEAVKADINSTFAGISFNSSILPVPERSTITFCNNFDTSAVDDLGRDLVKITRIGLILVAVVVLVLLVGHSILEWYKWWCLKRHLKFIREAWMSDPTVVHIGPASAPTMTLSDHNLLMLHADSTHPLLTRIANKITSRFHLNRSQYINLSWFFHYIFHPPALACFLIGFFGILSVQLQLLAIAPLEAKFHDRANAAAADLSGNIFTSLNQSMYNQSATYANDVNSHIDNIQSTINDGLFGWVNGTTTTLNNTVNAFYSDLQDAVSTLFNGTVLEEPAQEFIKCFIGSKVDAIENALTFLHDNLHIDITRVNESILVVSPDEVNAVTTPIAAAAVGNGDSPDGGLVGRLIDTYVQSLKKERIMFAIFLLLWAVVVLMGLTIIFWHSYGRRILDSWRKRKFQRNQRTGIDRIVIPFREEKQTDAGSAAPKEVVTPIPIRRIEPSNPESLHPLSNVPPAASRSFDSFFDHPSPATAAGPERTSMFRTLSRKIQGDGGWRKHLTLALRGDKRAKRKSFRQARRPQLTITTDRPTSMRSESLPEIERISPTVTNDHADRYSGMQYEPKSAWSLSPTSAPIPAVNPGARRKPSVPVSVGGEADSAMPSPAAVAYAQFAVPMHYGVARSVPARKLYIPPTPTAGQGSARGRGENPFVTPFDDDARVLASSVPVTAESMVADISFLPVSPVRKDAGSGEMSFVTGRAL
jgi:hypothetical protein